MVGYSHQIKKSYDGDRKKSSVELVMENVGFPSLFECVMETELGIVWAFYFIRSRI